MHWQYVKVKVYRLIIWDEGSYVFHICDLLLCYNESNKRQKNASKSTCGFNVVH